MGVGLVLVTKDALLFTKSYLESIDCTINDDYMYLLAEINTFISAANAAKDEAIYVEVWLAALINRTLTEGNYRATRILEG